MLINLTPHEIVIYQSKFTPDAEPIRVPPSGAVARVVATRKFVTCVPYFSTPIDVTEVTYGEVEGLPAPAPDGDVFFIVSGMVLAALSTERKAMNDVFAPGELVRDATGHPVGCKGLVRG